MATATRRTLSGKTRDVSARCTHPRCPFLEVHPTQSKAAFSLALHVRRVHTTPQEG